MNPPQANIQPAPPSGAEGGGAPDAAPPQRALPRFELYCYADPLSAGDEGGDAATLVALAWRLRERDSRRALELALRAETQSHAENAHPRAVAALTARIALIRAETSALFCDADDSRRCLDTAARLFREADCAAGQGDVKLSAATIDLAFGGTLSSREGFAAAAACYAAAGEPARRAIADAWCAYLEAYSDPVIALESIRRARDAPRQPLAAGLDAILTAAEAAALFWRDPPRSVACALKARELAHAAGLVRLAIMCSTNAGWVLECLGEIDTALECVEWAVQRARQTGWSVVAATTMTQLGAVLRELGQLDRSLDILHESVTAFASVPGGMHKGNALSALGHTLLVKGEAEAAIAAFMTATQTFRALQSTGNLVEAIINLARAHSAAGNVAAALEAIADGRKLIDDYGFAERGVALHQALAELHKAHALPLPGNLPAGNASLHYLEEALATGQRIQGWVPHTKLLLALAEEHHAAGNPARAYALAREAIAIERGDAQMRANGRSAAMQARHESEQARAEAEHHRSIAAAMTRHSQTLHQLNRIGREITASLDEADVFAALVRHIGTLTDAPHLAIWLLDAERGTLHLGCGVEDGRPLPPHAIPLDHPHSLAAACVRGAREVLVDHDDDAPSNVTQLPGTRVLSTAHFYPLTAGDRVLGAISFQCASDRAFTEHEQLVFRNLSAYTAIALDNTRAYQQLRRAQAQLEQASLTDPLTGMRNRRYFLTHIEADAAASLDTWDLEAVRTGLASGADLIFFLIDLDNFKLVNDGHGHASGDAVLAQMRARLEPLFRTTDHIVRWGGEEFLVVVRTARRDQAADFAERICRAVKREPFHLPEGMLLTCTCSVGFASFPFLPQAPRAVTWQEVVELADTALYATKNSGRDGWVGLAAHGECGLQSLSGTGPGAIAAAVRASSLRVTGNRAAADILAAL